ncbi:LysM-like peptidoglycan-binding domain-containing protein [Candidatus Symbiopectobacterium sp.]|uniref:LysM-like peptidoglycan-binding domain-containing protein n=1 Tax=Candidatus Symbiopectobacterium sp. TaxID=2816440 RepID=UPI0025BA88F1|nr:LysM-like peptidoglycan-binding domain-containing protein [Candidatus Symbiopectobacterium sp.]
MGRIAPRKRVAPARDYQALIRSVLRVLPRLPLAWAEKQRNAPSLLLSALLKRVRDLLRGLWHHPDGYHWMDPLPAFHRRAILIAFALLLIALLWPYSPPTSRTPSSATPITLNESAPMHANLADSTPAPVEPAAPAWQTYPIAAGQTLAQLFRDNNLPVNDVFAMAQVEGRDKPLSNLRAGQQVKLRLNAQGMVSELEIETADGQRVHFTRQSDGVFLRTR